ncbi:MAG: hypothetical protein IKJ01_06320 [Lachnospiraceae bacterium]|nr:hypothetical protein [Lachnospiraceae bacterium]
MKVSKVDHIISAVGENEQKVNGMLYHFPNASGNGVKQLKQHVQEVSKKAQNLYSIFVPVQKIEKEKKIYMEN